MPKYKKASLSIDQAFAQAKSMMRGSILSQEDYHSITSRMQDVDIYPFTIKLVNVGIKVAKIIKMRDVSNG